MMLNTQLDFSNKNYEFDFNNPVNYDISIIQPLSKYFNKVTIEYFSRILYSYSTEILNSGMPDNDRHFYYRACMNVYAACLYAIILSFYKNNKINPKNSKSTYTVTNSSLLDRNSISKRLYKKIIDSQPKLKDFKALRYQSHVLANISEESILDYLFINYLNTAKFNVNLKFVSKSFKSSFDKVELLSSKFNRNCTDINDCTSCSCSRSDSSNNSSDHGSISDTSSEISDNRQRNLKDTTYNEGCNSDSGELEDILGEKTKNRKSISKRLRLKSFEMKLSASANANSNNSASKSTTASEPDSDVSSSINNSSGLIN
ncbi:hypothetical protein PACTADRAFT_17828 [Pachysolen tannophilus NRRL Y-2460]|uniref:Uncharacterized protein n=1 Tax=Pachysolen tannophilus NRRL Y-2460 TaxID=669874 RepID=A0A1E4TQS1_PACTA|nr:hypothetical protein PACTADRAFT_17828 [Pachysolen tannophilus NRRL Y-2460]